MFSLKNSQLDVAILDPKADAARFATRYCTGGYIFQIEDAKHGPLLTGPTYPDSFNWFDGQGIPDAFNLAPLKASESEPIGLILGIGLCDLQKNIITEPCHWEIEAKDNQIRFSTRHSFHDWAVDLERTVTLIQRTVRSDTRVVNTGRRFLPISWFPHPFYPQLPEGIDELIKLSVPVTFPENNGYQRSENGFICRKGWPWGGGHYQPLEPQAIGSLVVQQRHPALGMVSATCSYTPTFFPIWGNQNTFSWEPFYERTLAPDQIASWRIDYDF